MKSKTTIQPSALGESEIIWLEDAARLGEVREGWLETSKQRGPLPRFRLQRYRVVGYANLAPTAPRAENGGYRRRFFYV